ncbi:MAG: hypothetical protein P1V97_22590 [Planctomycetota bacterium]|nr:hypothetical protein [Planctomycetota bacterium]
MKNQRRFGSKIQALLLFGVLIIPGLACSSSEEKAKPNPAKTVEPEKTSPRPASSDSSEAVGGNMEKAVYELNRGLRFMEKAYSEDRIKQRIVIFNQAITVFKRAYNLYLDQLLVAAEADKEIIEEQVEKINRFLIRCHRDRPAIK